METSGKTCVTAINKMGFTLVEVLMAITIFSIGFLAVSTLVIATTRNNTTGNIMTKATMLARGKIEQLKMASNPALLVTTGTLPGMTAEAFCAPTL